jgi:hypothetical protein
MRLPDSDAEMGTSTVEYHIDVNQMGGTELVINFIVRTCGLDDMPAKAPADKVIQ